MYTNICSKNDGLDNMQIDQLCTNFLVIMYEFKIFSYFNLSKKIIKRREYDLL